MKTLRRNLSYSNVAATLALVFAMSGGALAATHYAINSTKQINPKVLKALKGTGKLGPQGQAGTPGPAGVQGKEGSPGKEGKAGPAGAAATKLFAVVSAAGTLVRGSGALSAERPGAGEYYVKFNQDIRQCAFLGTVGTTGFELVEHGDIDIAGANGTTDTLLIETFTNAGTQESKSFHIAVLC